MKRKHVLVITIFIFYTTLISSQVMSYQSFRNIHVGSETINCFFQDSVGMIWVGTNRGLYSYDGYSAHVRYSYEDNTASRIYCMLQVDSERLFVGGDNGVLVYNIKEDRYIGIEQHFPSDVRAMLLDGDDCKIVWIGSLYGLYMYDLEEDKLMQIDNNRLPYQTIYSLISSHDDTIYIGTYNGAYKYDKRTGVFEDVNLPLDAGRSNLFVNSLLEDTTRNCIWVGTEGSLFKYSPDTSKAIRVEAFNGNSIKSMMIDFDGNLLIGTDNGLYVYHDDESIKHVIHDSGNDRSLSDNIVWNIFMDRENNIWLGTDYGISLCRYDVNYQSIHISELSDINAGNQFYAIFRDSRNDFWFGGTNGLILKQHGKPSIWYRQDDSTYPISHNRTRYIYEDRDGEIWIATDGGVNHYDRKTGQFVHYNIVDSSFTRNANWSYSVFEDLSGRLWISTCLGGVFVVDKKKLLTSSGYHIAEMNFSPHNGLASDYVTSAIPDYQGNVWVLLYNNGINKIHIKDFSIIPIKLDTETINEHPTYIICDSQGYIWAGSRKGVWRINPADNSSQILHFDDQNNEVLSMTEENANIWVNTTDGIFLVNRDSLTIKRLNITSQTFTSSYFDAQTGNIYMGGANRYTIFSPNVLINDIISQPITISTWYANNIPLKPNIDYKGESIRYLSRVTLPHNRNSLRFELTDLTFSTEERTKFTYKLDGIDEYWRTTSQNDNIISYHNLPYGTYTLYLGKPNIMVDTLDNAKSFTIEILPPWYYTMYARAAYVLLIAGIIAWIINFFRVKAHLKIERIEREKLSELSSMKINFFTDVSHEFKTPLSMIIAPISRMIHNAESKSQRKDLEIIQHNAFRLNSLISQILEFNRIDKGNNSLSSITVDFIPFAKSIFSFFCEVKDYRFTFHTNVQSCSIMIDVLKMESVLNNILSNACKFSRDDGEITFTLNVDDDPRILTASVSNDGIGIPNEELPYVFERFYQSKNNAKRNEGSGIGLYLAKSYVELHGGTISISSTVNEKTVVSFTLPLPPQQNDKQEVKMPDIPPSENAAKVLIVEDNHQIASFISETLSPKYRCFVADNGKTGLSMCTKIVPDLIIADMLMPVMDGLTMCRRIKKHIPTSTVPIIMLTAKDDIKTERESININIDAFMSKPFDVDILTARIEQLLSSKQKLEDRLRIETLATPVIDTTGIMSHDEKTLSRITQLIEDNISDVDFNVTLLSKMSDISQKQLYRKTKQMTGKTPVEYIRSIRMKKAAILLSNGTFSVAEVMYMVGFSSASYFSKCFSSEFGKAPKEWT